MKLKSIVLAGAAIALGLSSSSWAQKNGKDPSPTPLQSAKSFDAFNNIQITNFQDEPLGRIKDIGIDLVNGRIVEVLVITNASLEGRQKIVAVPPTALLPDLANGVYRLNVTQDLFDSAPAVDIKRWEETGHSAQVSATYRLFGQAPYFAEEGDTRAGAKVTLGYVERSNKLLDLPVTNLQNEKFGKVWSLTFDIPQGRVINVIVLAPGNFKTKSVISPLALSFNTARNGLLLDDSKMEFSDEPRFIFTQAQFGHDAYSRQEADNAPLAPGVVNQGNSYGDIERTVRIHRDIRAAKINGRNVQIGTINGRVTLRGWVHTAEDKRGIAEIAGVASSPEPVDNQITVGRPGKAT